MARNFNGTSDVITLTPSSAIVNWLFGTMVAVVKRANNTNWNGPMSRVQTGGSTPESFLDVAPSSHASANALWCDFGSSATTASNTPKVLAADGWVLIAAAKATGSVAPVFHYYVFNTGVWTRVTGSAQGDSIGITGGTIQIGAVASSDFFAGDIDVVAFFPTALSNAQIDTLPASLAAWDALSPSGMWVLNQPTVGTSVTDRTGNGSNQSSISGTSIASTNSPLTNATSVGKSSTVFWPGAGPARATRFRPTPLSAGAPTGQSFSHPTVEAASAADVVAGAKGFSKPQVESGGGSEVAAGAKGASAAVQDATAESERPTGAKGSAAATSTTARIADLPTSFRTASRANVEAATADGRAGTGTKSASKAQIEPVSSADRPAGAKSATGATSSAVVATDQPATGNSRSGSTSSGVRATESSVGQKSASQSIADAPSESDRPAGSKLVLRAVISAPTVRDAAAGSKTVVRSSQDLCRVDATGVGAKRVAAATVESARLIDLITATSVFRDVSIKRGKLADPMSGSLALNTLTGEVRQPINGGGIDGDSI